MISEQQKKDLREAAKKVQLNSYSPYSHAKVGAAVLTEKNSIYAGCNVENGSYGATVCAERSAISVAVAQGEYSLKAVYVYTQDGWPPCGMCRQVIKEFAMDNLIVILGKANGEEKTYTLDEIYPHSFGPKDMEALS